MPPAKPDLTKQHRRWILGAVLVALLAWLAFWGIVHLPVNGLTKILFFLALFAAVGSTLLPAIAYLNARFFTFADWPTFRMRFLRQSISAGLLMVIVAWLQTRRVLNVTVALILIGVFILIETFLITREAPPPQS